MNLSPAIHLAAGAALGGGAYLLTGNAEGAAALLAGSTAIDLDHIYDYTNAQGLRAGLGVLAGRLAGGPNVRLPRLYLWLHSWELMTLLTLIWYFWFPDPVFLSALLGAGIHMAMDQFGNPGACRVTYFLTYRILVGFRREDIVTD